MTPADRESLGLFSCGNKDLDEFLQEHTVANEQEGVLRTHLALGEEGLLGYVSILTDVLKLEPGERDQAGITNKYPIPAVKVARLGVAAGLQRGGLGTLLMNYAMTRLFAVSELVGCRFLVVDAKIETKAEGFYERLGFVRNLARAHANNKHAVSMRFDPFVLDAPQWVSETGEVIV